MADPLVVQLANDFRQRLRNRDVVLTQEMGRRWLAVEERLWADMLALAESMAAEKEAGRSISRSKLFRFERYQQLLAQAQAELSRFNATAGREIERAALANVLDGLDDGLTLIDGAVRPYGERGVSIVLDRLGIEAAENVAALARAGQPLNVILDRSYPAAVEGITDRLIDGIARGINPREVARRMRNDGLSQGLNHILLVARDQSNRAYRQATLEQYRRSGVVYGYRRISAKQARTCAACLALDGKFYELDEPFEEHPQGRCTAIPAVKGFEPVGFQSGEVWFNEQPAAVQRQILGNDRYEAWGDGLFEFSRLAKIVPNEVWGPSAQVRSLRELVGQD
jgi:SPP1 gp7 family putative phage head morphogenesis protein